jgi:hypothetical protein
MSMKGMDPLEEAFISLAIILIFFAFAISPLQSAMEAAIENDAKLNTNFIASATNLIQAAPPGTEYKLSLPKAICVINVTEKDITYTVINKNKAYSLDIIENFKLDFLTKKIKVNANTIICKKGTGLIKRSETSVDISGSI